MTRSSTLIAIGLGTIAAVLPARRATLRLEDATSQVGGLVHVMVDLDNPGDDVRGLQFNLSDVPPGLHLEGVEASGRAAGLAADAQQQPDGTVKVILISLGKETVEAGSGPVLNLNFTVRDNGGQSSVRLTPEDVRVAGTDGELDATGHSGQLQVEGGSTATTSGGSCAVWPIHSAPTLWPALALVAVLLVVRRTRFHS
jgi:Cohesin domain